MKYEKNINYQRFVNEILDDIVMASDKFLNYTFFDNNAQFTFETINGKIDFYPTSNKISFRDSKGWRNDGLNCLLSYVGNVEIQTLNCCPNCGHKY